MERTQRRARNGRRDGHDETGDLGLAPRVEGLRQRFARFRREHKPRTRFPHALRAAALAVVRSGAAELEVRRACRVSSVQLAQWRRGEGARAAESDSTGQPARVFSVVDEMAEGDVGRGGPGAEQDVELRLAGWAIWIRRLER
jgi:hypothetical protein